MIGNRIREAYLAATSHGKEELSPIWAHIAEKNKESYRTIESGENFIPLLDDPGSTYMFYGFDNLHVEATHQLRNDVKQREFLTAHTLSLLVRLAEAIGAKRVWNPEITASFPERKEPSDDVYDVEALLESIDEEIGCKIDFPNPFPNEYGLETSRGMASHRALYAIYQAWRLKQLSWQYGSRILEIGAGLGRTAYYARKMGIDNYTIVDIPQTNISQANFLLRTLGEDQITLYGEQHSRGKVRILPVKAFHDIAAYILFDIMLNVDSFTEMNKNVSSEYALSFIEGGKILLSINHEANTDTVHGLPSLVGRCVGRFPYAMRPGYVEELFWGERI